MPKYIEVAYLENLLKDRERCGYLDAGDIYNAPAADVAPVVHGQWIEDDTGIMHYCYDTETYFDLGANKFAYRTIKQYTHDAAAAPKGE